MFGIAWKFGRFAPLASAALLALCTISPAAAAPEDATVKGTIYNETLDPAEGATVVVHDAAGASVGGTVTAKSGIYSLRVPAGDYTVEASLPGHIDAHSHVRLTAGAVFPLELFCMLPNQSMHVVVVESAPEAPALSASASSVSTVSRTALKTLPKGEDRPITDVIATEPGFVLDGFGNVYARGNHGNIQYQVDGIPIPDSVGGVFAAALPVRLVENLNILTGGLPAEFGDRLSAVVDITTRRGGDVPEGSVGVRYGSFQTVEPSATYSRTFGRFGVFVGGSYLSTQRGLDPPSVDPILHDDAQDGRLFLRLDWTQSERDRVELFATYAYNRFQIPLDPSVAQLNPGETTAMRPLDQFGNAAPSFIPHDTNATETEHEMFVAASWLHTFANHGELQIAPYYKLSWGALIADAAHALGVTADPGSTASDVIRRADHAGSVARYSIKLGNHVIKAGLQGDWLDGNTNYTEYVRDDAAPMGGPDPAQTASGSDHTRALLSGAFVQDSWQRGRFTLQAGARVDDQYVVLADGSTNNQYGASPRLGVSLAILKQLMAHAFVGINWQPPAPLDAGNAARALGVVPAGQQVPYDVKAQTDVYGEAGLDTRPIKQLHLGVVGWGRYAWNQLDDVAVGSTNLIANYNFTRGRAVGVEGRVDVVLGYHLNVFANVSWEIAQGQGIASAKYLFTADQLNDPTWQTLDHSQTWTANGGATLREKRASLTLMGTYGSGLRTGANNTDTVPGHIQADATLQYDFAELPGRPHVAIDIINLFDDHYAFRIANGFVGSSYGPPLSVYFRVAFPLGS